MFGDAGCIDSDRHVEYMEKFTASFDRSPPGTSVTRGDKLSEAVRRRPYSVVLFDETKGAPGCDASAFAILEDGKITDSLGARSIPQHESSS